MDLFDGANLLIHPSPKLTFQHYFTRKITELIKPN